MKKIFFVLTCFALAGSLLFSTTLKVSCYDKKYAKLASHTTDVVKDFLKHLPLEEELKPDSIHILIAESESRYRGLSGSNLPEWSNAVTIFPEKVIVVKTPDLADVGLREYDRSVKHEVVHLVHGCIAPLNTFPLWFTEGLAEYFSGGISIRDKLSIAKALVSHNIIPLGKLRNFLSMNYYRAQLAYSEAGSLVEFLVYVYGTEAPWEIIKKTKEVKDFSMALKWVTAVSSEEIESMWMEYLNKYYRKMIFLDAGRFIWGFLPFLLLIAYIIIKLRNKIVKLDWSEADFEDEFYENSSGSSSSR